MRTIVEFGFTAAGIGNALPAGLGVAATPGITFPSAKKAMDAARQIAFVLARGQRDTPPRAQYFAVRNGEPRVTWWSADRAAWVTVSLLDGVARGSFAATVKGGAR